MAWVKRRKGLEGRPREGPQKERRVEREEERCGGMISVSRMAGLSFPMHSSSDCLYVCVCAVVVVNATVP